MAWHSLPLDLQKLVFNFLKEKQHPIRVSSHQTSQLPFNTKLCCLPPNIPEIINYFKLQSAFIKDGTYYDRMKNYGLIQELNFTNGKTLIFDPHLNGNVQNLLGEIVSYDQIPNYLKGSNLILYTNNITSWHALRTILNSRTICLKQDPLIADECFLKLLFQQKVDHKSILSNFLIDPSMGEYTYYWENIENMKDLSGEESESESDNESEDNISEKFIDTYLWDRIKSMKYLDKIDLHHREGYLPRMMNQRNDVVMLIALLNRGIKYDLVGALGEASRDGNIGIVRLLLRRGVDPTSLRGTTAWRNNSQITKLLEEAEKR